MAYTGPVRRWDTYWADLDPGVGHEQKGGGRPVIVVSNDGFNAASFGMVTVVSVTKHEGKERTIYPFEVLLPRGTITPDYSSIVLIHQIRAISKLRLLKPIGTISDEAQRTEIEDKILEHLEIAFSEDEDY